MLRLVSVLFFCGLISFSIGCEKTTAARTAARPFEEESSSRAPVQYEYKVESFYVENGTQGNGATFAKQLNDMAQDGWEYVGPLNQVDNTNMYGNVWGSSQFVVFRRDGR